MNPGTREAIVNLKFQRRIAGQQLIEIIGREFPKYCFVKVDCPQFNGFGVFKHVHLSGEVLAVELENGNTWFYPTEVCTHVDAKDVPRSVRRVRLRLSGIRCL